MGYSTTIRLKGELDSKFKGWGKHSLPQDRQQYKSVLLATCRLISCDYENNKNSLTAYLTKAYKEISFAVTLYVNLIANDWKVSLEEELKNNENKTDLYGWQYSDDYPRSAWEDLDELKSYFTDSLFQAAVYPTNSPYSKEDSEANSKEESLNSYINDIEDCVWECLNTEFIRFYRNHPELADESDGYNRRFPEEKDVDEDEKEESEN